MAVLTGSSVELTVTDDNGTALPGLVLNVTGPNAYSAQVTTSAANATNGPGRLRLTNLPIGDYTITNPTTGRSGVLPVLAAAAQVQATEDRTLTLTAADVSLDSRLDVLEPAVAGKLDATAAAATFLAINAGSGMVEGATKAELDAAVFAAGGGSAADIVTTIASAGGSQALTAPASGFATRDLTLTAASCSVTASGGTSGQQCVLTVILRQDATGSRLVAWPSNVVWASGIAPTLSTAPGATDIVQMSTVNGGTSFFGVLAGAGFTLPVAPAVPGQVTGLSATPGDGQVGLAWATPASNGSAITGYQIFRGTVSGTRTLITTTGVTNAFTDTGRTNGTALFYTVAAVNGVGTGPQSTEVTATPTAAAQAASHLLTSGAGYAYTSGANALSVSGAAIDLRVLCAPADWTPAASGAFTAKWAQSTSASQNWLFVLTPAGQLQLLYNSGAIRTATSTVSTGFADGTKKWVRATLVITGGTANVSFFTSDDGISWTQLGTTVSTAATSISTSAQAIGIGANRDGTSGFNFLAGKFYRAEYRIDASSAPAGFVDFQNLTAGAATFTDSAGGAGFIIAPAAITAGA